MELPRAAEGAPAADIEAAASSVDDTPTPAPTPTQRALGCLRYAKATALKQCLPIALLLAITFGLAVPIVGQAAASWTVAGRGALQTLCVWIIFTIQGITLKTDDVRKAVSAWKAIGFGVLTILFITPLLAPLVGRLALPLRREFSIGFMLFCSVPTTINSGVALATQAKGSFALALMLTVLTNLLGVFTVPFFLGLILELGDGVRLDPVDLLLKLIVLILCPLTIGKAARELVPRVAAFAKQHKQPLGWLSNGCLALIPWMKLSESEAELKATGGPAAALVIAIGLTIHACYLVFNYGVTRFALRLPSEEVRAVTIMGSQKTLPVAMAILASLPDSLGEHGLIAVPCIVSHLTQIFVDAWIATKWASVPIVDGAAAAGAAGAAAGLSAAQDQPAADEAAGGAGGARGTGKAPGAARAAPPLLNESPLRSDGEAGGRMPPADSGGNERL